jgi:murein DD-endopeptidase MepM/ murein hydrolase activator NlpD
MKLPLCIPILLLVPLLSVSAERVTVTVEKGDTLYSIGRNYGVSVQQLIEVNGILNPRQLRSGIEIVVPYTHEVERGDTLYGISRRYGVSVDELCRHNGIDENEAIHVGQVITIPHSGRDGDSTGPAPAPQSSVASAEEGSEGENGGQRQAGKDDQEASPEQDASIEEPGTGRVVQDEHKKADSQSHSVQEVRYEKGANGERVMWPHSGKRMKLTGKLKGTQIEGEVGDRIVAVSSGKVVWVAPYRGYGELVMVENSDGHIYAYGGNEETFVEVGDRVEAGTVIGRLGINPVERNAKVFFFVYRDGRPIDPEKAPRG